MRIFLSYGYEPNTTAIYLEEALSVNHEVFYFGPPFGSRKGYSPNENVMNVVDNNEEPPDLFLFSEPLIKFFPQGMEKLSCPTACYVIDTHRMFWVRERYARFFDYIFVCHKDHVDRFKSLGYKQVYWLPVACDPRIHGERISRRIYDIGFVGNWIDDTKTRSRWLKKLSEKYRMNDYKKVYPREEISSIYSQSKIVVNIPVNDDLNMRVFEAMASGALLITKSIGHGQKELFKDGVHLVEYTAEKELFEKVAYYLKNDDERKRIAKAGQRLVLREHTYKHRCDFVIETIFGGSKPLLRAKVRRMVPKDVHVAYTKIYSILKLIDPIFEEIKEAHIAQSASFKLLIELVKGLLRRAKELISFIPAIRKIVIYLKPDE